MSHDGLILNKEAKQALKTFIAAIEDQFSEKIEHIASLEFSFKPSPKTKSAEDIGFHKDVQLLRCRKWRWDKNLGDYVCAD